MLLWPTCGIEGALGRSYRARFRKADSIPWALPRAMIVRPFEPPNLRVPEAARRPERAVYPDT
jgi:hypothetical protein